MKRCDVIALSVTALALPCAAAPLDVKTGLWEINYTVEQSGNLMPKDLMESMPADQRAKLADVLKRQAEKGPQRNTHRTCLTKEDLAENAFGGDDKSCRYTYTTRTATKMEGSMVCAGEDPRKATFKYEVLGRDKVKGQMRMNNAQGAMAMQIDGRWLEPECKD